MRATLAGLIAAAFVTGAGMNANAEVGAIDAVKLTATVDDVNSSTREVTLKGADGSKVSFIAGPEVRNFAQIAKGDVVTVAYGEAIAMKLEKTDSKVRERTVTEGGERAKAGEKPGLVAIREVNVVASVEKVDAQRQLVTLRGPEHTVTLKVTDPANLKRVNPGDFVRAVYTEAVAIKVEPAK